MPVAIQERPVCFECDKQIETNAEIMFEAPCGHLDCSSAVFHPLCLMEWRDKRAVVLERVHRIMMAAREHHPDCPHANDDEQ